MRRHHIAVFWLVAAAWTLSACGAAAPAVDVEISAPAEGSVVVADEPVALEVRLDGAELVGDDHAGEGGADDHDASADDGVRRGHLHVFVDDQLVSMPSELEPVVTLPPGSHTVSVEFVDEEHLSLEPAVTDEIRLEAG